MIAAKNGQRVYENQLNLINNLPIHRNKYSIKSIFANYWNEFVNMANAKNKHIRPAIMFAVDKLIHCKDLSKGYLFFECPKCNNFYVTGFSCNSRFCPSCGNRYREDYLRRLGYFGEGYLIAEYIILENSTTYLEKSKYFVVCKVVILEKLNLFSGICRCLSSV